jgi:hypothetical protein
MLKKLKILQDFFKFKLFIYDNYEVNFLFGNQFF